MSGISYTQRIKFFPIGKKIEYVFREYKDSKGRKVVILLAVVSGYASIDEWDSIRDGNWHSHMSYVSEVIANLNGDELTIYNLIADNESEFTVLMDDRDFSRFFKNNRDLERALDESLMDWAGRILDAWEVWLARRKNP